MNFKTFLIAPAILLMANCKTQTQSEPQKSDGTITVAVNKKVTIPDSKISIEFQQISEDSRCPANVTCVWEGIAIVNLKMSNGKENKDIQFATRNFEPKNAVKSLNYDGYNITLQDVKPYPGGKQEAQSITLKYEKE